MSLVANHNLHIQHIYLFVNARILRVSSRTHPDSSTVSSAAKAYILVLHISLSLIEIGVKHSWSRRH